MNNHEQYLKIVNSDTKKKRFTELKADAEHGHSQYEYE